MRSGTTRVATAVRRGICVAACAALALTVTACDGGKKSRGGGSHGDGSSTSQDEKPKVLKLGQAAPDLQTFKGGKKPAKYRITPTKVSMGKPGDLADLDDQKTAKGKVPAWIYVKVQHAEGPSEKEPMIMSDIGAKAGGASAKRLIMLMGDLKATPKDCVDEDDTTWTKGKTETICDVYLVPEGKTIDEVLLSRGFTAEPQRWSVSGS